MADVVIAPPINRFRRLVDIILDGLIKGIGEEAIIASAVSAEPWLALWGINWIFTSGIGVIANAFDTKMKIGFGVLITRYQDQVRLDAYNKMIANFKQATPEEHAAALAASKAAADAMISKDR